MKTTREVCEFLEDEAKWAEAAPMPTRAANYRAAARLIAAMGEEVRMYRFERGSAEVWWNDVLQARAALDAITPEFQSPTE